MKRNRLHEVEVFAAMSDSERKEQAAENMATDLILAGSHKGAYEGETIEYFIEDALQHASVDYFEQSIRRLTMALRGDETNDAVSVIVGLAHKACEDYAKFIIME